MDIYQVISFIIVALLLVVSPGPNGVLIVKSVSTSGKLAGFVNIAGFMAAFYVHGALSVLGISVLLVQSGEAFLIFKLIGASYLIWIGIKSCLQAWNYKKPDNLDLSAVQKVNLKQSFIEGFLTNALNPKVSMFYLAAFPQFLPVNGSALQAFSLVAIHSLLNLIWFSAVVMFFVRVKDLSNKRNFTRWLKSITGPVFIAFGTKLAFLKHNP